MSEVDITPDKVDKKPKFLKLGEDEVNPSQFPLGMKVGGYSVGSSNMKQGKMDMQSGRERILIGDATDVLSGKGIFLGKDVETNPDSVDYEFRAGDPSNDYIHWDGSTLDIKGDINATDILASSSIVASLISVDQLSAISADLGTITAGTITGILIQTSSSGSRVELDGTGGLNDINIYDSNSALRISMSENNISFLDSNESVACQLIADTSTFTIGSSNSHSIAITADSGEDILMGIGGTLKFSIDTNVTCETDFLPGGFGTESLGGLVSPWSSLYLKSPDDTVWEITVDNSGNLQTS